MKFGEKVAMGTSLLLLGLGISASCLIVALAVFLLTGGIE